LFLKIPLVIKTAKYYFDVLDKKSTFVQKAK